MGMERSTIRGGDGFDSGNYAKEQGNSEVVFRVGKAVADTDALSLGEFKHILDKYGIEIPDLPPPDIYDPNAGLKAGTTEYKGVLELATIEEVDGGIDNERAITPYGLDLSIYGEVKDIVLESVDKGQLTGPSSIDDNGDLNTIIDNGFYFAKYGEALYNITNKPIADVDENKGFRLHVMSDTLNDKLEVTQIYYPNSSDEIYIRRQYEGVWSDWAVVNDTTDKLNNTTDTLRGSLTVTETINTNGLNTNSLVLNGYSITIE